MADSAHTEQTDPTEGPPSAGGRMAPVIAAVVVASLFAVIFLAALGSPRPHGVAVAVVGSQRAAEQVQGALDANGRTGFDVQAVPNEARGRTMLEARDVYGVASPQRLLVSSFNGEALNAVVESALTASATPGASTRPVVDVHEGAGKPGAIFYAVFGMVIGAMVLTIVSGAAMTRRHNFAMSFQPVPQPRSPLAA